MQVMDGSLEQESQRDRGLSASLRAEPAGWTNQAINRRRAVSPLREACPASTPNAADNHGTKVPPFAIGVTITTDRTRGVS
jgi:hypothetical protein